MNKLTLTILFFGLSVSAFSQNLTTLSADSSIVDTTNISIQDSLSAQQIDSLQADAKKDTLRPLEYLGYSKFGNVEVFEKSKLDRIDYRYLGDVFNSFPFGYNADLGSIGNPEQIFINGLGWGNISYLQNGITINNRFQNALNLNLVQSENIDSIEVPSLASGFLFNNRNNPVSVNLITRTKVSPRPYSRIKFYQAPENEGMFSGLFSAYLFKRVNFGFSLSNQSADPRYKNSELSNWQFNTNLRYMVSNELNFLFNYDYNKTEMGLNGGVDINATSADLIFDNVLADVNYIDRYHKINNHSFSLSTLFQFDSTSYTNITLYYQYNLNEFRQNESSTDSTNQVIINDNSHKSYGINLQQVFTVEPFNLDVVANYEETDFNVDYNKTISSIKTWSVGGRLSSLFLSDKLKPSVFVKASGFDDDVNLGIGGEVKFRINNLLELNAGASKYKRSMNPFDNNTSSDVTIVEAGLATNLSFANISLSYFNIKQTNYQIGLLNKNSEFTPNTSIEDYTLINFRRSGLNLIAKIKLWKLQLESNSSLYFNESTLSDREIPTITSFGGLYYIDTLFNSNLDLKAGINYKFYGERGVGIYDFQKMQTAYYYSNYSVINSINSNSLLQNNYQLDLFVAGTIRENATIYIIFENLLDEQYYVVPYYPIQPRGFRLGVAWEFFD